MGLIFNTETKSYPIIFHAQGKTSRCPHWNEVNKYMTRIHSPKNIDIITWNSGNDFIHSTGKSNGLVEKCVSDINVLKQDLDSKWTNAHKISLTIDFIKYSKKEYIMGMDSSDVIVIKDMSGIEEILNQYHCDILFNAEVDFWPPEINFLKTKEQRLTDSKFAYMNAGVWLARREVALLFFEHAQQMPDFGLSGSEQVKLKQSHLKWYPKSKIDHNCLVFQTLNQVDCLSFNPLIM